MKCSNSPLIHASHSCAHTHTAIRNGHLMRIRATNSAHTARNVMYGNMSAQFQIHNNDTHLIMCCLFNSFAALCCCCCCSSSSWACLIALSSSQSSSYSERRKEGPKVIYHFVFV